MGGKGVFVGGTMVAVGGTGVGSGVWDAQLAGNRLTISSNARGKKLLFFALIGNLISIIIKNLTQFGSVGLKQPQLYSHIDSRKVTL